MKISIQDQNLKINFSLLERLMSFKTDFVIPVTNIMSVSFKKPCYGRNNSSSTFSPKNPIKTGTFYNTNCEREFWYVFGNFQNHFLSIKLKNEYYSLIILEIENKSESDWEKLFMESSVPIEK